MPKILLKTPDQIAYQKIKKEQILRALGKSPTEQMTIQAAVKPVAEVEKYNSDLAKAYKELEQSNKKIEQQNLDYWHQLQDMKRLETRNKELEMRYSNDKKQCDELTKKCFEQHEQIQMLRHELKTDNDHGTCKRSNEQLEQQLQRARAERDNSTWKFLLSLAGYAILSITILAQLVIRYVL